MSEIYMAGPSVTEDDIKYVLDSVRDGWYGDKAYYYVEKFEADLLNIIPESMV